MVEEQILCLGVAALSEQFRSGELGPRDVLETHIARIVRVNARINALVAERFEAARAEADAAEQELARTPVSELRQHRPLLGVPFTVKEMIAVAGMPYTFGSRARRDVRSERDATVISRLRAAGAIPLGVSNTPEWGMWNETYNDLYGRTSNPWDLRRTPGGSSGGEGALVGAGCSVFGVGSDIGGSVRMPAAFCGTYAHKPGGGVVPLTGHYPVVLGAAPAQQRTSPYLSIGVFARSAADLMPLLRVMHGPDDVDPNAEEVVLRDPAEASWTGRRVLLLPSPRIRGARRASQPLRRVVDRAGACFAMTGADVAEAPADLLLRAGAVWSAALQSAGGPPFATLLGGGTPIRLGAELARAVTGRRNWSWPALLFCVGERIVRRSPAALERALRELATLDATFRALLGDGGILIAPVHPRPAPRHGEPAVFPWDFLYTAVFNALRVPVSVVPMGFDRRGLPLAVQVAAARGNDHLTIAAALQLESSLPAWRPAPA